MSLPLGHRDHPQPRRAARVLLVDDRDRVLLLHGRDPRRPQRPYWFTVGGGLDEGESAAQGAVRELAEETGLVVAPQRLGEPVWHEVTEFAFGDYWYRQEQDFFLCRVPTWEVSTSGHDEIELAFIDAYRWWSIDELVATDEVYYPAELPRLLREILER